MEPRARKDPQLSTIENLKNGEITNENGDSEMEHQNDEYNPGVRVTKSVEHVSVNGLDKESMNLVDEFAKVLNTKDETTKRMKALFKTLFAKYQT